MVPDLIVEAGNFGVQTLGFPDDLCELHYTCKKNKPLSLLAQFAIITLHGLVAKCYLLVSMRGGMFDLSEFLKAQIIVCVKYTTVDCISWYRIFNQGVNYLILFKYLYLPRFYY